MTTTTYLWDTESDNLLSEADGASATAIYSNEPNRYGSLVSQNRSGTTSTYHFDAMGSTFELTGSNEDVIDTYLYDSWGNVLATTGSTINSFRWTGNVGYYFDSDTEEYYIRARTYQPAIGRWLSSDPLLFVDGSNLYRAYFIPETIDPSGLNVLNINSSGCYEYCASSGGSPEYCLELCNSEPVGSTSHPGYVYWGEEVDRWNVADGGVQTFTFPPATGDQDRCQCRDGRFFLGYSPVISIVRPTVNGQISGAGATTVACELNERVILRYKGVCVDSMNPRCECSQKCSHYVTWFCKERKPTPRPKPWMRPTLWVVEGKLLSKCQLRGPDRK